MKKILLSSLLAVMAVTSANAKIASTDYADGVAESKAAAAETAAKRYTDFLTGDVVNSDYIKGLADKTLTGAVGDLDSRVKGLTTGDQAAATKKELEDGLATKLDRNQGASNAGKGLIVDTRGNLALTDVATDAELAAVSEVADGAVTVNTQQGTAISKNTTDIATNTAAIGTINSSDVMTSGATKAKIEAIATNTASINAINNGDVMKSGITATKVTQYDGYATGKQDTLSTEQLAAVNSGATKANIEAIATNTAAIGTINSSDVMTSGATKAKIEAIATNTASINAINNGDVMKSGITAAKVTQYDGYASGKQNTLSETQLAAVNSGATKVKIEAIATNTASINTINNGDVMKSGITAAKVTQYDGYASGKQDKLTEAQLAAVNSGATADIINATSAFQAAVEAGTVNEEGTYVLTAKVDAQTKKVTGYAWENIDRSFE